MSGIVRLDNVAAINNPALAKTVKYFISTTATEIENGNIVALSGLVTGERETFKAVAPTATSKVLLTCGVELLYDETTYHGLGDYTNVAGKPFRAIYLQSGDIYSVTADCLDAVPAVGNFVTVSTTTKPVVKASVTTEQVIGTVIEIETVGIDTYYVIAVA